MLDQPPHPGPLSGADPGVAPPPGEAARAGPASASGGHTPDYDRGLCVSGRPGPEFLAARGRSFVGAWCMQQAPLAGLGVLMLLAAFLRGVLAIPGPALVVLVIVGYAGMLVGIYAGARVRVPSTAGSAFARDSDSRYRVRVAIPPRRRTRRVMGFLDQVTGHSELPSVADLAGVPGGFEPVIARAWFAVPFDRRRALAAGAAAVLLTAGVYAVSRAAGGVVAGPAGGIAFVGLFGIVAAGSLIAAELALPVYLRVVPGRLDVFRYGLLGLGRPEVESFDLRERGVSVDFASFTLALEPPRPLGEPLPALVTGNRWPYAKRLPEGFDPVYVSLACTPGRLALATTVVQAARTAEPTPTLPMDRLLG